MNKRWRLLIVICSLSAFLYIALITGFELYRLCYQPMNVVADRIPIVRIKKSMTASSLAHYLKSQHLIKSERLFLALVRAMGVSHQLKAGIYQIKAGETSLAFLYRVATGDVLSETFQIIEGTTQRQVSERLKKAVYLQYASSDWLAIATTDAQAEGLLLADTYRYNAGSSAKTLLERAHQNLIHYLETSWQKRTSGLPYKTSYDLLIAASILEKEAALPEEKRLISGVIVNRLRRSMPLQMDPTVIYGLGAAFTGKLTHDDLKIDSPYNTYRYRGLPPTPIAMVGKDAIDAAAHPALSDYLYFVARGDGTHAFSTTYDKQRQAIDRYIKKSTQGVSP